MHKKIIASIVAIASIAILTLVIMNTGNIAGNNQAAALIGWWNFGVGSSTGNIVTDSSGSSNDASLINNPIWTSGALSLDGTNDFVDAGNNQSLQISNGTISAWVKTTDAGPGERVVIGKRDAYNLILINNKVAIWDPKTSNFKQTNVSVADNTWHHIAFTFQSGRKNKSTIYVDGVARSNATFSVLNQNNNLQIGNQANTSQFYKGLVNEARVYNGVLSSTEIWNLYSTSKPVINPPGGGTGTTTDSGGTGTTTNPTIVTCTSTGPSFCVSPSGLSTGDGSANNPFSLANALANNTLTTSPNKAIQPGHTLWLRGGTYNGTFRSDLRGSTTSPITIRAYPSENPRIANTDTNSGAPAISVYGSYVIYRDLEITRTSYSPRVSAQNTSWPTDLPSGTGISIMPGGNQNKLINLIIHDNGQGIGAMSGADNTEIYGNLIYFNGWNAPSSTHGHGAYLQNKSPSIQPVRDNVFIYNANHGSQFYGSSAAFLDNALFEGNIYANNGQLFPGIFNGRNMLIGGGATLNNAVARNNSLYRTRSADGTYPSSSDFYLGYTSPSNNSLIEYNYIVGANQWDGTPSNLSIQNNTIVGKALMLLAQTSSPDKTISGNKFFSKAYYVQQSYPAPTNTYAVSYDGSVYGITPTSTSIFVRPNQYETGRANIAVYNWPLNSTVPVNISNIGLNVGDTYELHNAFNYYDDVVTGTYTGSPITINMAASAHTVATPLGISAPTSTFPEFGAFIIKKR